MANGVSDFFDTLMSDIKQAFTGPEDRNYGTGYEYQTPREKRFQAQRDNEAYYANLNDDAPRAVRKPKKKKKPIKTVDQFYAELSNKGLWGALPSLRMERGDSPAPQYGNVDLKQREGGVARSLFNPYGE